MSEIKPVKGHVLNNWILTCLFFITEVEIIKFKFVNHKFGFDKRRTVTHRQAGKASEDGQHNSIQTV